MALHLTTMMPRTILNCMVQYQSVDRTLAALADPTRRQILERLSRGPQSISDLAQPLGITLTGVKKHIRVLEDAGLVDTRKVGRVRECELGGDRLENLEQWITDYRQAVEQRLDRMAELLERRKGDIQ
jgi:DNA-binding transcriptional ArsR family regulator